MQPFQPVWYTIEEFAEVCPVTLSGREQERGPEPFSGRKNVHVLARTFIKKQGLPEEPLYLRLTGDDYYKAYINGEFVGQGPAPGYPGQYYYNQMEISRHLNRQENELLVHLYYQGLVNRVFYSGDGRMALAGEIVNQEGQAVQDLTWEYQDCFAYEGQTIGYDTQFLENFDSRRWKKEGPWRPMKQAVWADYRLVPEPAVQVEVKEEEVHLIPWGANTWRIDLGREIAGALRIGAVGKRGAQVTICCGEELDEQGEVRFDLRCGCRYEEVWTLDEGFCVYEPFDYKGFRYARIKAPEGVDICWVKALVRHYPMDPSAFSFHCENTGLNRIMEICIRAVKYGSQEGYIDCPTREKGQYLGDALVTANAQVWLTGSTKLLRKCLRQFAFTSSFCPGLLAVAPGGLAQEIGDFSLLWPSLLMLDYSFTGDRSFLEELYPAAREIIRYFARYEDEEGLLNQVSEKWNLVDWPENLRDGYEFELTRPVVAPGSHNVINALYVGAVKTLCRMEEILGKEKTADWERLRDAFVRRFYDRRRGLFTDRPGGSHASLHSNVYPLYFGLTPQEGRERAADFLEEKGFSCGVFLSYFSLKALCRAGRWEAAFRLILNDTEHGWVNMLREGATACFEAWGKEQKWNTSLCHPWASAPVSVLVEDLAGFRPCPEREEGFVFEPHLKGELLPDGFSLKIPFRGRSWRVEKQGGSLILV